MDLTAHLLATAARFCEATGMSKARLATLLANDGKFLARLEGGGGCTVRTYQRAMAWLSDRWPAETPWPEGVKRPR